MPGDRAMQRGRVRRADRR